MRQLRGSSLSRSVLVLVLVIVLLQWIDADTRAEELRLPVSRDTWFSQVGSEANTNLGGSARLKLKSNQEMSLVDLDPTPLRGKVVKRARLHLRLSSNEEPLRRVSVSSVSADWVEGTSPTYQPEIGSSTFLHRKHPDTPWTVPGSDFSAVVLSQGGSTWHSVEASAPVKDGWQVLEVDPRLIAARIAGVSYGFLLFDDTGSEWTRDHEKFDYRLFPNRFVFSKDSRRDQFPYWTIEIAGDDSTPPAPPTGLASSADGLPAGEAIVTWIEPNEDQTGSKVVGYRVTVDGKPVPRYLIPSPKGPGQTVAMHLRDWKLAPGQMVRVEVQALDGAGNAGSSAGISVTTSNRLPLAELPASPASTRRPGESRNSPSPPRLAGGEVWILDPLDKVDPRTGKLVPAQPESYIVDNHLHDRQSGRITLAAARNEFVGVQLRLQSPVQGLRLSVSWQGLSPGRVADKATTPQASYWRIVPVNSGSGAIPDPCVPLVGAATLSAGSSVLVQIYVPHQAKPGDRLGSLELSMGVERLTLPLHLTIWDFALPDQLGFLPEMNCYDLPADERSYYRLAHEHRTVINRVPYYQNGEVAQGHAPGWDGKQLDFSQWDARFAALFDGSAFRDLPRSGVPIECFYLPIHENWPSAMEGNYNGGYWADQAFPPAYRATIVEVSRQFAAHLSTKGWTSTIFEGFWNNKVDFKRRGWSRGSSPWLLDEPSNFQDYWALQWYGQAFHEGVRQAGGKAVLAFRCDISRPQWQRDIFDGLLNVNVVSGDAFTRYRRLALDRKQRAAGGQLIQVYGSTNTLETSNYQPVGWCLDTWTQGADGVIPWQTVGNAQSWEKADALSLFYPGTTTQGRGPFASIRLKAYLRGQQDVEYLALLAKVLKEPRWSVGAAARRLLKLDLTRRSADTAAIEDAGRNDYDGLRPQDLDAFRRRLGAFLSSRRPTPEPGTGSLLQITARNPR